MLPIRLTVLLGFCLVWPGLCALAQAQDPPSTIVIISLDTQRPDALGFGGLPEATSPVLDRLSRESLVFANAYSSAPWTVPSHGSMFTGLYSHRHRADQMGRPLQDNAITLAEWLNADGFRTGGIVTSPIIGEPYNFQQGFEFFQEVREDDGGAWAEAVLRAENWLKQQDGQRVFLFLHLYTVHQPYTPKEPYGSLLLPPQMEKNLALDKLVMPRGHQGRGVNDREIAYLWRRYLAETREQDALLGGFMEELRATRKAEDTLLVVMSDHGEAFGEKGQLSHANSVYDETMRVVTFLNAPGRIQPGIREDGVGLWDLFTTIMNMAGQQVPDGLDGRDIRTSKERVLLPGETVTVDKTLTTLVGMNGPDAIEKLIVHQDHQSHSDRMRFEVFDLVADPGEERNLAPEQPQRLARMYSQLRMRYGDAWREYPPGWCIQLSAGAREQEFQLVLETDGYFLTASQLHLEKTVDVTSQANFVAESPNRLAQGPKRKQRMRVTLRNETQLLYVATKPATAELRIGMGLSGQAASTKHITLATPGRHPESHRLTLRGDQRDLVRDSVLPLPGIEGFALWFYPGEPNSAKTPRPTPIDLDPEVEERLRGLGYID